MFVGLHAVLAMKTGVAELAISDDEGAQFMARVADVQRHYDVRTTQKTMDWIALVGCAAGIYVPRAVAFMAARNAPAEPESAAVIEMPQFIRPNGHA
jgi:hypothetical protein